MRGTTVADSLEQLPSRFLARSNGLDARFRLKVGTEMRDVVISNKRCRVEHSNGVAPDVEIHTDAKTWRAMDEGRLSGIEAFAQRKLSIRGSIEKSLKFEPQFDRPDAGAIRYSLEDIRVRNATISALIAGDEGAQPLVLIHGLGATKASWLTIVGGLARRFRVIAIDLPGFGASSKPLGRYDAPWFAGYVGGLLNELDIESALIAGNSMGGRVAMELAMRRPHRVDAIACLCPAAAFTYRPGLLLARLMRPELGIFAGRLPRSRMREGLRSLFADSNCIADEWYDAAIDDFLDVWKSPRARIAFSRSLRNIYLDEPEGEKGFWTRLSHMETPALFIYGRRDMLITHHFGRKIRKTVPHARVSVWNDCGHVPQIEFPERTTTQMTRFFSRAA
ncbi:MAG TPA: alpha/beta fold hydrolase [Actinomycetota bacterium]|nr:alpha/beta fold hydrolase [Actinomycetota bacterium]